jgi:hypothetical protein
MSSAKIAKLSVAPRVSVGERERGVPRPRATRAHDHWPRARAHATPYPRAHTRDSSACVVLSTRPRANLTAHTRDLERRRSIPHAAMGCECTPVQCSRIATVSQARTFPVTSSAPAG